MASNILSPMISLKPSAAGGTSLLIPGRVAAASCGSSLCISLKATAARGGSSICVSRRALAAAAAKHEIKAPDEQFPCKESVVSSPPSLLQDYTPWLMLTPAFDWGRPMMYRFYSLANNTVGHFHKVSGSEVELPDDDAEFVGSSHGWLVTYNNRNGDLFLSDPQYRRHIKLLLHPFPTSSVANVILSCSPSYSRENCRALMIYGPENRLAFCCPGHDSTEWTPMGDGENYQAIVYSAKKELFFCIRKDGDHIEKWNLRDPRSPFMIFVDVLVGTGNSMSFRSEEERELKLKCKTWKSLVVAEETGDVYHVRRFVTRGMVLDGFRGSRIILPYQTIDFVVHKYDEELQAWKRMNGYLDGLTFFVGENHGFALRSSDFPALAPNDIYFTDIKEHFLSDPNRNYGGHDIGIFHCWSKIITPCFYSRGQTRIEPPPMWYAPNPCRQHLEWVDVKKIGHLPVCT